MYEVKDVRGSRLACKVVTKSSLKTKKAKTKVRHSLFTLNGGASFRMWLLASDRASNFYLYSAIYQLLMIR